MLPLYLIIWNGNSGHTFTSIECTTICVIEMVVLSLVGATLMRETTMEHTESVNYLIFFYWNYSFILEQFGKLIGLCETCRHILYFLIKRIL